MPKTMEELRENYENAERELRAELAAVEKRHKDKIEKARKALQAKCNHEFVIEVRQLNDDYRGQCGCFYQPDPRRHSKAYFRACCVCGASESSVMVSEGVFSKLNREPIVCYYDSDSFDSAVLRFSILPLPNLRAEAERLRKEGGE